MFHSVKDSSGGMISYFVRYRGSASDPEAFHAYYEGEHAALLRRFPGIRSLICIAPLPQAIRFRCGGAILFFSRRCNSTARAISTRRCAQTRAGKHVMIFTSFRLSTAK
jgi:hypothetical protein